MLSLKGLNVCRFCVLLVLLSHVGAEDVGANEDRARVKFAQRVGELLKPGHWVTWENDDIRVFDSEQMNRAVDLYEQHRERTTTPREWTRRLEQLRHTKNLGDVKETLNRVVELAQQPEGAIARDEFYEVFEVGQDYVGLRRGNTERFVQLTFVKSIIRTRSGNLNQQSAAFGDATIKEDLNEVTREVELLMHRIATEEVNIDKLTKEGNRCDETLLDLREDIKVLERALDSSEESVVINGRNYSTEQVKVDLERRQERLKLMGEKQKKLEAQLQARDATLARWQSKLDQLIRVKRALQVTNEQESSAAIENRIDALLRRLESLTEEGAPSPKE